MKNAVVLSSKLMNFSILGVENEFRQAGLIRILQST